MVVRSGSGRHGHRGEKRRADRADSREAPASEVAGLASRKTAARLLAAVVDAKTPLDGLTDAEHGHPQFLALDVRDRGLVRAILASALRHRRTIEALIAERLHSPLPANATTLSQILHVGAAQILFLDVPDSAAVDLAVTHAKSDPRTARFAALVNAVLRGLAREKEQAVPRVLGKVTDAPDWFVSRLREAYDVERTEQILAAHRVEPPTDFTVKSDPQRWAAAFGGIVLPTGSVRVARLPSAVPELPGYAEGEWWVQDAAAALPARLLGAVSGVRVADLCAAPGGKTAQLAFAGAKVTAVDTSRSRLERLTANLARLQLEAEVVQADVLAWRPAENFDAILLDAPCSSTGTVRRHPDVLWTKSPADVEKLAALQRRLLDSAVALLRPGGRIVFSNCSLDPAEGEDLVRHFLADHPEMELERIAPGEIPGTAEFVSPEGLLRTTPADFASDDPALSGMDGFFAVRLRRRG
ncbi:RsmB/NOP family class I SAM-dependent RNA methyltransferase [Pseudaminobacter soli (ex Zhang et al. 2022)]|uniref:RsmB/NOP family class I SAM-dependent RNA methyltransferase n=1 Tax=Pseudaminobacter soli (ex Zhang et al. 2022) TaxID=2831468 RepID=UPI001AED4CCE|nr:RsmB/NOP family class I SAM-dependent RNA methyltransferase [Pseudaminobacter soli]